MGNSLEQAQKRCDFGGGVRSPFLRRWAPLDALKRLMGILHDKEAYP